MPALDWASRATALDAAITGGLMATDLALARQLLGKLNSTGPTYSSSFTAEIEASKNDSLAATAAALTDWFTATSTVHVQADRACRFAGSAGPALAFDADSSAAILARIDGALSLPVDAAVSALLASHRAAVVAAYASRPGAVYVGSYPEPRPGPSSSAHVDEVALFAKDAGRQQRDENGVLLPWAQNVLRRAYLDAQTAAPALPSVKQLEDALAVMIAQADALLAEIAFP